MMRTSASRDEAVENVRQRIEIVELIGRYVKLKKSGSNFVGLCPFHAEKTPSFSVSPQKRFFHCFGCQTSGDVFSFLMKLEGKSFPEVLEELALVAGVALPQRLPSERGVQDQRKRLLQWNELAATFYEQELWSEKKGKIARDYLQQRGLTEEIAREFRLGYAEKGWHNLAEHMQREQVSLEDGVALGLLGKGPRGMYDIFRDRLVFPIFGPDSKVHGFGARKLDSKEEGPKYINSRQSLLYDKSETLYGLVQARRSIADVQELVLVEGYFDVLSPVSRGIKHVVATCGTALTESHAKVIKRMVSKVITVFDADPAGQEASYRSAGILLREGLSVYMASLPPGDDPDSYVLREGGEAFAKRIHGAKPTIEELVELKLSQVGRDVEARTQAVHELVPLLSVCADPLRLGNYVRLVSDRFSMNERDVLQTVMEFRKRGQMGGGSINRESFPVVKTKIAEHIPKEEEDCVVLVLRFPQYATMVMESGALESFSSELMREALEKIIATEGSGSLASAMSGVDDSALQARMSGLVLNDAAYPEDKAESMLRDCLVKIRKRHLKGEERRLTELISQMNRNEQQEERKQLQQNKMRLNQEMAALEKLAGK